MDVDLGYLKESSGNDPEIMKELIQLFIEQVQEMTVDMQNCLFLQNWTELGKIAHKAKHSVAVMGLKTLAEDLKDLERMAREGTKTDLYPAIVRNFEETTRQAVHDLKLLIAK